MHIKIMYNIITFKNVFQYQTAKFNNAKLQSLLHEPDSICVCVCVCVCVYMRHLSVLFAKPGSKWLITIFKFDLFTEL